MKKRGKSVVEKKDATFIGILTLLIILLVVVVFLFANKGVQLSPASDDNVFVKYTFDTNLKEFYSGHDLAKSGDAVIVSGGRFGNALSLQSGVTPAYVSASDFHTFNGESYSVSMWVKPDFNSNTNAIFAHLVGQQNTFSGLLQHETGPTAFVLNSNEGGDWAYDAQYYRVTQIQGNAGFISSNFQNEWIHLVGVYDASTDKILLYANGAKVAEKGASATRTGGLKGNPNLYLGSSPVAGLTYDGLIDEFVIFDKALSADEISRLYSTNSIKEPATSGICSDDEVLDCPEGYSKITSSNSNSGSVAMNGYNQIDCSGTEYSATTPYRNDSRVVCVKDTSSSVALKSVLVGGRCNNYSPTSGGWKEVKEMSCFSISSDVKVPPCGDYGDVDGDGDVDATDADMAGYTSQLDSQQEARADVNHNGDVSSADRNLIEDYVAGVISTFPVCSPVVSCTDSDGGLSYYVKGTVRGIERSEDGSLAVSSGGSYDYGEFEDFCEDNKIFEYICGGDGGVNGSFSPCPYGCSEGACLPAPGQSEAVCSDGIVDASPGVRARVGGVVQYCDPADLAFKDVGANGDSCLNDFECSSNACIDNQCVSLRLQIQEQTNLLKGMWCWFRDKFGVEDYDICISSLGGANNNQEGFDKPEANNDGKKICGDAGCYIYLESKNRYQVYPEDGDSLDVVAFVEGEEVNDSCSSPSVGYCTTPHDSDVIEVTDSNGNVDCVENGNVARGGSLVDGSCEVA